MKQNLKKATFTLLYEAFAV